MRKLILIRHSVSKIDEDLPPYQWGLTEEGRARCYPLAARLTAHNPGVIITSEEPKAAQTGEIVARELGLPCSTAANLHEHRREGGIRISRDAFRNKIKDLFENPGECVFGLESALQALNRFRVALQVTMELHPDHNVAIVSHGTVMSLYYGFLTAEDPYQFWCQLGLPAFYTVLWPEGVVNSQVMRIETF